MSRTRPYVHHYPGILLGFLFLFLFLPTIVWGNPLQAEREKCDEEGKDNNKILECQLAVQQGSFGDVTACIEKLKQDCYTAILQTEAGKEQVRQERLGARSQRRTLSLPSISGLNPLGNAGTSVSGFVGRIIQVAVSVMGTIAFVMFIYGGILWMFSQGNSEKAAKASKIIVWSALGVVVIFSSYTIIGFIVEAFKP